MTNVLDAPLELICPPPPMAVGSSSSSSSRLDNVPYWGPFGSLPKRFIEIEICTKLTRRNLGEMVPKGTNRPMPANVQKEVVEERKQAELAAAK